MVIAIVLLGVAAGVEYDLLAYLSATLVRSYARIYGALYALFGLGAGFGPAALVRCIATLGLADQALYYSMWGFIIARWRYSYWAATETSNSSHGLKQDETGARAEAIDVSEMPRTSPRRGRVDGARGTRSSRSSPIILTCIAGMWVLSTVRCSEAVK